MTLIYISFQRWCQGSPCRAIYSEDGQLYEATIVKIFDDSKTCIVKFIGKLSYKLITLFNICINNKLVSRIPQQNVTMNVILQVTKTLRKLIWLPSLSQKVYKVKLLNKKKLKQQNKIQITWNLINLTQQMVIKKVQWIMKQMKLSHSKICTIQDLLLALT